MDGTALLTHQVQWPPSSFDTVVAQASDVFTLLHRETVSLEHMKAWLATSEESDMKRAKSIVLEGRRGGGNEIGRAHV